ncbi:hypothetical protein CCACVL1_29940 [Corchorus capsularis]|uniref:Uncharacterized protein n=1 Tax=Corchorus capsularis TaxID=210143 RepID=A0A1R3FZD7_COCAP|nr:hypothetical protein CCACVL1_29940 [Corchorus capsularis]
MDISDIYICPYTQSVRDPRVIRYHY